MKPRRTHEEFLSELICKNKKLFDSVEFLEEYKNAHTNLLAKSKYGLVSISPISALKGCELEIRSAIRKTEYWINMAKDIRVDFYNYNYEKVEYKDSDTHVTIGTKYGDVRITPSEFLMNQEVTIKSAIDKTKYWIEMAKEARSDFENYDFSNVVYKRANSNILLIDRFGLVKTTPRNFIDGKTPTIRNAVDKTSYCINQFKEVHGDKYDYSKVRYIDENTLVKIICEFGHEFDQKPVKHKTKRGCPHCNTKIGGDFTFSQWELMKEKSSYYDSYKIYIIKCNNDEEEFYKIGRTGRKIEDRFDTFKKLPYESSIVKIIESEDAKYIWDLEIKLHRKYAKYKYTPKIEFGGRTECFSLNSEILYEINQIL